MAREAIMAGKEIAVKKYVVRLSSEERQQLETLIRKGKGSARRPLKRLIAATKASELKAPPTLRPPSQAGGRPHRPSSPKTAIGPAARRTPASSTISSALRKVNDLTAKDLGAHVDDAAGPRVRLEPMASTGAGQARPGADVTSAAELMAERRDYCTSDRAPPLRNPSLVRRARQARVR